MKVFGIFFFILLTSCDFKNDSFIINVNSLQGDWINDNRVISFWDTLFTNPTFPMGQFVPFQIKKDSILFNNKINERVFQEYLIIEKLTKDSLVYIHESNIYRFENASKYRDTTKFFNEIHLSSSLCDGNCPKQSMLIRNNGQINYKGYLYTEYIGNYSGTISPQNINRINNILILYDLDDFQSKDHTSVAVGGQYIRLYIRFNNDYEKKYFGPLEGDYKTLKFRLLEILKFSKLQKDTTQVQYMSEL